LAFHFSNFSFWVHQPVNRDGQHLLAHAMATDFSWHDRTIDFFHYGCPYGVLCGSH
jgi:hypothetical protein